MCLTITRSDGSTLIICGRSNLHGKRRDCAHPGCRRDVIALCDGPADPAMKAREDEEAKGRCSAPLCEVHRKKVPGDEADYCWVHQRERLKEMAQREEKKP